jgi:hypothetical protein
MAHGGKRPGAGRKPGALTVRTREVADKAIAEGISPLEVMLANMRFYHQEAIDLVNKLTSEGVAPAEPAEGDEDAAEQVDSNLVEQLRTLLMLRKMAGEEAARAAPYVHPRVGYDAGTDHGDPEFVPLADRLAYYQRRDELKEAGDNVVPLKP